MLTLERQTATPEAPRQTFARETFRMRIPAVANQAQIAEDRERRREEQNDEQRPETPEDIAAQLLRLMAADSNDSSGQVRTRLDRLDPEVRSQVTGRMQARSSQTEWGRVSAVLAVAPPRTVEAPLPSPEEVGRPAEETPEEALEPVRVESAAEEQTEAEAEAARDVRESVRAEARRREAPQQRPESALSPAEKARAAVGEDQRRPEPAEKAPSVPEKSQLRDGGELRPAARPGVAPVAEAATQTGAATPEQQAEEKAAEAGEAAEKPPEGEALAPEAQAEAPAAGAAAEESAAKPQAEQAMASAPPEAKAAPGEPSAAPARPGQAAPTAPALPSVASAEGAGGGEAAAEEESPEAEAAEDRMEEAEEQEAEAAPEPEAEPEPAETSGQGASPEDAAAEVRELEEEERAAEEAGAPGGSSEAAEPEEEAAEDSEAGGGTGGTPELSAAERQAALDSLAEAGGGAGGSEGGSSGGGGGGGGGAAQATTEPEPPDVSSMDPAAAVSAISGSSVGVIAKASAGLGASVTKSVSEERAEAIANAPSMQAPTGSPVTRSGPIVTGRGGAGGVAAAVEAAPEGAEVAVPEPEPLADPGAAPTDAIATPQVEGAAESNELTPQDAERIQGAVDELPTTDPALYETAGPAPVLELEGNADPQQAVDQREELDATLTEQQEQGAADAAEPMGEDEIYPQENNEILTAEIPEAGPGAAPGGPVEIPEETAAIVAEENDGATVRAAAETARGDIATEQQAHADAVTTAQGESDTNVTTLISDSASAQDARREAARSRVGELRGEWTDEQQQVVDTAQTDATNESQTLDTEVENQQRDSAEQAQEQIDTGNEQATEAREDAEGRAESERQRGENESSGIIGWLKDRAKAFFNRLKKAIGDIFAAARRAVRRAIEAARRLAAEAIEAARSAVVGAIRVFGDAVIAIGDVALAAFPEARERFRGYVEEQVNGAEQWVNEQAEELARDVDQALQDLGAGIDAALGALERGLMAAIDGLNAAVNAALDAAQAVIDAIGTFAALIADIASDPGGWISNLGSAVVDGIQNHLWTAFKEAVRNWFNQKLQEVIGVPAMLFNVLAQGGIQLAQVGTMAWDGIKAAIPPALIAILIEKLVSMIVPAAGAVMAIIEGLQAAWGTISRILQAIGRFIAFLKAVRGGGAGPQFAQAVAAAAVVVIDFVANWLIRRIRGPAGRVGGRIRAIAQRMMRRVGRAARRAGQAVRRVGRRIGRRIRTAYRRATARLRRRRRPSAAQRRRDEERRRRRNDIALARTREAINTMLSRGTSPLIMRARLLALKLRYRWRTLRLQRQGAAFSIQGVLNPTIQISPTVSFQFDDVAASPVTIPARDVQRPMGQMEQEARAARVRQEEHAPIDPTRYAGAAIGAGILPQGQAGPILTPVLSAPSPAVTTLAGRAGVVSATNPRLQPATAGLVALGSRRLTFEGTGGENLPDYVLQENAPGQILRSINVEVTLDVDLAQSHKATQLSRVLVTAHQIYSQFPAAARSPNFEIVYLIIAPLPPPEATRNQIVGQLNNVVRQVNAIRARVIWRIVPIGV